MVIDAAITGICLTVAITLIFLRKLPKTRAVAMLAACYGIAVGNLGGWGPHLIRSLFDWGQHFENIGMIFLIGVAVPGLIVLALAIVLIHDLWPKNAAKMRTTIIAFILPFLWIGAGASTAMLTAAPAPARTVITAVPGAASTTGGAPGAPAEVR